MLSSIADARVGIAQAPRSSARWNAASASRTRSAIADSTGRAPGAVMPVSASGCALTMMFIGPWRNSVTSRERWRATGANPIVCSTLASACGCDVAYLDELRCRRVPADCCARGRPLRAYRHLRAAHSGIRARDGPSRSCKMYSSKGSPRRFSRRATICAASRSRHVVEIGELQPLLVRRRVGKLMQQRRHPPREALRLPDAAQRRRRVRVERVDASPSGSARSAPRPARARRRPRG